MRHNTDIVLFNIKNDLYRQSLERAGYQCFEGEHFLSCDKPKEYGNSTALFEIDPLNNENIGPGINYLTSFSTKICVASSLTDSVRSFLLKQGTADFLRSPTPQRLVQFLNSAQTINPETSGEIIILDKEINHRSILTSVLNRFRYAPLFVPTTSAILDFEGKQKVSFIAVNLGDPGLDLRGLIRAYNVSASLKRIPLLAYHDARRGIFIHELLAGLNRITSYILSTEELYSFLVDVLYRKEISPILVKLQSCFDGTDVDFTREPLNRIYIEHRDRLFSMKSVLDEMTATSAEAAVDAIKKVLIRVEGLRWLAARPVEIERVTCGAGALI